MKTKLVSINKGKVFTTTLIVAEACDLEHKNVISLVRKYSEDFEEFNLLTFQTRARLKGSHGGGSLEYANLSEDQATYLITLFRNTDIVRKFKVALVKAFRKALDALEEKPEVKSSLELIAEGMIQHINESNSRLESLEKSNRIKTKKLKAQESRIQILEYTVETSSEDYYSVAGYASSKSLKVTASMASILGKRATKLSLERDYVSGKVHSDVFGLVSTYHKDILKSIITRTSVFNLTPEGKKVKEDQLNPTRH